MKKILALILTLAMMLTMLNVGFVASAADEIPAGAVAIDSYEDLLAMEAGKYYYLTGDITLGSPEVRENVVGEDGLTPTKANGGWEVITEAVEADMITIPAGATLDGCGYTIYYGNYVQNPGLKTATEAYTSSLKWTHEIFAFGEGAAATLKNVKIGTAEKPVHLDKNVGTKADGDTIALIQNATTDTVIVLENVSVYAERGGNGLSGGNVGVYFNDAVGSITFNDCTLEGKWISAGKQIGGFISTSTDAGATVTFNRCTVNANLLGTTVGSFMNRSKANTVVSFKDCANITATPINASSGTNGAGGFMWNPGGAGTKLSFVNCVNYADIDTGATIAGGFLGRTASAVDTILFENCINYGDVSGAATTSNHGFGGFAGHTGASQTYDIINCKNFGDITRGGFSAGIVGFKEGDATLTVEGCENYGKMYGPSSGGHGGIGGQIRAGENYFVNCVNYAPVTTTQYAAGIVVAAWSGNLYLENCINYGDMMGVHAVAGLVAQLQGGTVTATDCLTTGDVHQYVAADGYTVGGEGLGGFFGRVASTAVGISATNCYTLGTVTGSNKINATYGCFGDTFGQFVGLYTVSALAWNYEANPAVGGFHNWAAETAIVPTFTNCYAYGAAVPHESGTATSLTGWVTGDGAGNALKDASDKAAYIASTTPVTEAPNGGLYGINVKANLVDCGTLTDAAAAIAAIKAEFGVDVMAGAAGENALVAATPAIRGYQESTDGASLRFLATVDSYNYEAVGYVYSVSIAGQAIAKDVAVTADYVLKAVSAGAGETLETKKATDLGGEYFIALTFINVPQEGEVVITVAPTADNYTGTAYTITVVDGVVTGYVVG